MGSFLVYLVTILIVAYVQHVHCPVLVLHSRDDEVVPFEFGTRIFAAANEPKQFVEIFGNHNDGFLVSGDVYKDAWANWLRFVEDGRAGSTVARVS